MNRKELSEAVAIAQSDRDLSDVDDSVLHGMYTRDFQWPVKTTVVVAAKMVRHLAVMLNGQIDSVALAEFADVARKRVLIV